MLEYWSIGVLEYWSIGVLEYWSVGVLECWKDISPLSHSSTTPSPHHSNTPLLQYSISVVTLHRLKALFRLQKISAILQWKGNQIFCEVLICEPAKIPFLLLTSWKNGCDPNDISDGYANYFDQNRNHSLIHQAYCQENPRGFSGYSADCWGLTASDDPDGDSISFQWWQYEDADSYDGSVDIQNSSSAEASFTAPSVGSSETVHIILEVTDNGSPELKGYQRIIVTVEP